MVHQSSIPVVGLRWQSRVQDLLLAPEGPVAVIADRGSGVEFVIGGLATHAEPLAWFRLDEHDVDDPVSQGDKLADAMARAVGAVLFGSGLPLSRAVAHIERVHSLLGPFTIVVSNAEYLGSGTETLLRLSKLGSRVILVFDGEAAPNSVEEAQYSAVLNMEDLTVTLDEAIQMAGDAMSGERLAETLDGVRARYLPLLEALCAIRGSIPVLVPEPTGATVIGLGNDVLSTETLVGALHQRGRSSEALELALRSGVRVAEEIVDAAGWEHASRGLYVRLWRLLRALPINMRQQSPSLMRWYFAAATAVNRHNEVKAEVSRYLQCETAPELRSLFAAAFPTDQILDETGRAIKELVSPTTMRIHAFALAISGRGEESIQFLRKAMRLSEALGQDAHVVACATDLADLWVKKGCYLEGAEWARWALAWYYRAGLNDEMRRMTATALLVYSKILIGDITALDSLAEQLDTSLAGIPTGEAVVSTHADWSFVNGDITSAERMYALNIQHAHIGQYHHLAIDHVQALMALGNRQEANRVARRAHAFTRQLEPLSSALGDLAMGLATSVSDVEASVTCLKECQHVLVGATEAPRLAQASIALAKIHLRQEREEEARAALFAGEAALRQLGFTGWTLLGGFDPEVRLLYQMFHGQSNELELHFFGRDRIVFKGQPIDLGLRQCECLVVMASRPGGVTAERLGMEVYGETAQLSTLKAIVSRLRQIVPIDNRPYRIGVSTWADFVDLERLLEAGRVREAMSLYRGPLLPRSEAPAVVELREQIDESVRRAVLGSGDIEALLQLAKMSELDLELYEAALERISPNDPRFPIIRARVEQVRRNWREA